MNQEIMTRNQQIPKAQARNYGIDLLRIVSMLYIVILHSLGLGGALQASKEGSLNYFVGGFGQMWVYCAVDIFALISGYVGYSDTEKRHNCASYLILWLQVVFWSVALYGVFFLIGYPDVGARSFIRALLPITSNTYWYFTAYTGLFFLIPVLNAAVRSSPKNYLRWLFAVMFILFSVYSTVGDRWRLSNGYSMIWLMVLYLMGAIMKKCAFGANLSQKQAFSGIVLCTLLSWLWLLNEHKSVPLINKTLSVETYLTPTFLVSAMLHVLFFSRLRLQNAVKKWIGIAAPGAFSVYIINCHEMIMKEFVSGKFVWLGAQPLYVYILWIIAFSVVFVVICLGADILRRNLFELLRIRVLAQKLTDKGIHAIDFITKKIFASEQS